MILIKCGEHLFPKEKDVTILLNKTAVLIGIPPEILTSDKADHLPTPEESAREDPGSRFSLICPQCGKKAFVLSDLCPDCKASEFGKYKSKLECYECKHLLISEKPVIIWLQESGEDFKMQTKKSLGIETITDKEA